MENQGNTVGTGHVSFPKNAAGLLLLSLFLAAPAVSDAGSRIDVHGGSLDVGGTLSAAEIRIDHGATLGGTGTLIGDLTVAGAVGPALSAASPVTLMVQGDATFLAGSSFLCRATSHTLSDQLNVQGQVTGTCTVLPENDTAAVPVEKVVITALSGSYSNFSLTTTDELIWRLTILNDDLLLTDLVGDSDGNGLPDWFELEYFQVRTGTDPDGNGDGDSLTNREEDVAGTDPTDGSSFFALAPPVHLGGSNWSIEWSSVAGRQYSLHYSTDLLSAPANPLVEDALATPPLNSFPFTWSGDRIFIRGTVEKIGK